jgi:hypothetical protein
MWPVPLQNEHFFDSITFFRTQNFTEFSKKLMWQGMRTCLLFPLLLLPTYCQFDQDTQFVGTSEEYFSFSEPEIIPINAKLSGFKSLPEEPRATIMEGVVFDVDWGKVVNVAKDGKIY